MLLKDDVDIILNSLSKSKFRSSFHLNDKYVDYINEKGLLLIKSHAYDFISKRLLNITNVNDGSQTPYKGHPVFIAQHATATCCRGCLEKWYRIDKNKILTEEEIGLIVNIIMKWIERELK